MSFAKLRVRHAAGRIFLDSSEVERVRDIRTVRLALSGGVVEFNVLASNPVPSIELTDLDAASWWLGAVIGRASAETVLEEEAPQEGMEFDVVPDAEAPLFDIVRRLALALWLKRWAPAPFQGAIGLRRGWLLDAEAGVLAFSADDALDPGQPLAANLLEPVLSQLASVTARFYQALAGAGAGTVIATILLGALDAAVEVADPGTEGFDAALDVMSAIARQEDLIADDLANFDEEVAALDEIFVLTLGNDPDAHGNLLASGTAPADPLSVPARVISVSNSALRWQIFQGGDADPDSVGLRCEVAIEAADSDTAKRRDLMARIDYGGRLGMTGLHFDQTSRVYRGEIWLDATASVSELESLVISVFGGVPGADTRPPRPYDERLADRDAVASVMTARENADGTEWNRPFATELADLIDEPLP